ncbi:unnamed protein product, partial [Phaeothamnion confervicola]
YSQLSGDSAHTSVSSLGLHLGRDNEDGAIVLRLTVAPESPPKKIYDTLDSACEALIGVCVAANEIIGGTPAGLKLESVFTQFNEMRKTAG